MSAAPGPVVYNSTEVIEAIQNYSFDVKKMKEFNEYWNQYSNGSSSKNLVNYLFSQNEVEF